MIESCHKSNVHNLTKQRKEYREKGLRLFVENVPAAKYELKPRRKLPTLATLLSKNDCSCSAKDVGKSTYPARPEAARVSMMLR